MTSPSEMDECLETPYLTIRMPPRPDVRRFGGGLTLARNGARAIRRPAHSTCVWRRLFPAMR